VFIFGKTIGDGLVKNGGEERLKAHGVLSDGVGFGSLSIGKKEPREGVFGRRTSCH